MWSGRNQRFVSVSSDLESPQEKNFFTGKTGLRPLVVWARHSGQSSAGGKFYFEIWYLTFGSPGLHVQLDIHGHGGGSGLKGRIFFQLQYFLHQSNSGWKGGRPDGVIPGVRQELWSPPGISADKISRIEKTVLYFRSFSLILMKTWYNWKIYPKLQDVWHLWQKW